MQDFKHALEVELLNAKQLSLHNHFNLLYDHLHMKGLSYIKINTVEFLTYYFDYILSIWN